MPAKISTRARRELAQNPGTIYLPVVGPIRPELIEWFTSNRCRCWVKFRGQNELTLLTWPLRRFAEQLPHWKINKVPGPGICPRKQLVPAIK